MNKFSKLYNEFIKKPTLTFENKEIGICIKRDDILYLLEYGKQLEQVLQDIKEYIYSLKTKEYSQGQVEEMLTDFLEIINKAIKK